MESLWTADHFESQKEDGPATSSKGHNTHIYTGNLMGWHASHQRTSFDPPKSCFLLRTGSTLLQGYITGVAHTSYRPLPTSMYMR